MDIGKKFSSPAVCDEQHVNLWDYPSIVISRLFKDGMKLFLFTVLMFGLSSNAYSQNSPPVDSAGSFTLEQCISYALKNQPVLNQSIVNQSIAKTSNAINISGWLPQLNLTGNIIHYNQLPTTLAANPVPGGAPVPTHTGVANTSIPEFSASQTIFDPQLLSAAKKAPLNVRQAEQITDSTRIFIVSNVSYSFYNLLLTLEQIKVLEEDTARLGRTVEDTHQQFLEGTVDETDYEQAVITLNNSKAQLRKQVENLGPGYAALKQLMGYPPEKQLHISFDIPQMEQEILYDTTKQLQYEKRIEFQELQTAKELQHQQTVYYKLSFLPTVSAFYNYYYEFESPSASNLFKKAYPYSYVGLSVSLPLFTGLSRIENLHRSEMQEEVLDLSEINLKSQLHKEHASALANYRSSLTNWQLLKDNQTRAKNVFRVVSLQYEQGIVAYLNLIVAESNLITAEIGYTDALFQLLSSKIELEKATGEILNK
jgi:outer membrane protein TolC